MTAPAKFVAAPVVADMYGVDVQTVRAWARKGLIPAFKPGGKVNSHFRFRLSAIEADIERREKAQRLGKVA